MKDKKMRDDNRQAGGAGSESAGEKSVNRAGMLQELLDVHLRVTRQRQVILECVRRGGHWHFTPEDIFKQLVLHGQTVTLATVYNTLHRFSECGLIRKISGNSSGYLFDSNIQRHHHATDVTTGRVFDIPELSIARDTVLPEGYVLDSADVMLYLKPAGNVATGSQRALRRRDVSGR